MKLKRHCSKDEKALMIDLKKATVQELQDEISSRKVPIPQTRLLADIFTISNFFQETMRTIEEKQYADHSDFSECLFEEVVKALFENPKDFYKWYNQYMN